jgi:transcriptional regulator with XRE-family HTH domain
VRLGLILRERRNRLGLSRREAAARVGLYVGTLDKIEGGAIRVRRFSVLVKLADGLDLRREELVIQAILDLEAREKGFDDRRRLRLAEARKSASLTQQGLADALGVPRAIVHSWEAGNSSPSEERRGPLAEALSVSEDELAALLRCRGHRA